MSYRHSEETKQKISKANKGHALTPEQTDKMHKFFETHHIISGFLGKHQTEEVKEKLRIMNLGSKNHNWKGGMGTEINRIRSTSAYYYWRKMCIERDNFTCQKCGQSGGDIQVHHINNFKYFPELRFAIDNGIVLCKNCHTEFHHIYSNRNNTPEQIQEFLKES